jgi:LPXTG-motif cell wall-anchored protein
VFNMGALIGVVIVLAGVGVIVFWFRRRRRHD